MSVVAATGAVNRILITVPTRHAELNDIESIIPTLNQTVTIRIPAKYD